MSHPSCVIVDDEAQTRFLLSQIFSMHGYAVRSAEDGFAALRMIRAAVPDLLVSDLNMPGMSGFELLSVVRRLYPQIRVIAISGAYTGAHVPQGIAADAFHEKGTGMSRLVDLMELGVKLIPAPIHLGRTATPLWVDLERRRPHEADHVLINCPSCLRPFRQDIDVINASIRETNCCYCGSKVAYAVALAIKPQAAPVVHAERALTRAALESKLVQS